MTVSNYNLPSKFFPFLLGHPSCTSNDIKNEIDKLGKEFLSKVEDSFMHFGKCVLEFPHNEKLATTPDTHLSCVRNAEKIRNFIINNKLEAEFAVPKKFLYDLGNKDYCVVYVRLDISEEVVSLYSTETREEIMNVPELELEGQEQALKRGAQERDLTPSQAKALAELSILGYTDQTFNNFFFTVDGKVAILFTDPVKRVTAGKTNSFFVDKSALLANQSICGIAKLKQFCIDPEARKQVELVEKNHVLWTIAKLTLKLALGCLVIYAIPRAISSLGLPGRVATLLKVSLLTLPLIKNIGLTIQVLHVLSVWTMSCSVDKGMKQILASEKRWMLI